jgi:hypothetical protein
MNDPKHLIQYKLNIHRYLVELKGLCLKAPLESELLSVQRTEQIRANSLVALRGKPVRKIQMSFEDKKAIKFRSYVAKLHLANPHSVFVWTEKSNSCGLYEISSLLEFNFNFEFDVNEQGIVVLLASNLADSLVFDFSYDDRTSTYMLEIDVCGDHWFGIDY